MVGSLTAFFPETSISKLITATEGVKRTELLLFASCVQLIIFTASLACFTLLLVLSSLVSQRVSFNPNHSQY